jgi:hypothetical protein
MVAIRTRIQLEHQRRVTGEKGIFVRHQDIRCRFCDATIFVPKWSEGSFHNWENVPAARELIHIHGGCPSCRPEIDWEISPS